MRILSKKTASIIDNTAVFLWFIFSSLKILFTNLVYWQHIEVLQYTAALFFWITGIFIILRKVIGQGFEFDFTIVLCIIMLIFSILNVNLITFVFAILVWHSIAHLIECKNFVFLYTYSLLFLIVVIFACVAMFGQVYYLDGRYGNVPTFGFENSNSFPQLLVVFLLISTSRIRYAITIGIILVLISSIGIKTRTMYIMIAAYPLMILLFKYVRFKLVVFLPLVIFIVNLFLVYNLNHPNINLLDDLLSYRLSYSYELLNGLSLSQWVFGSSYRPNIPMDMSFINLIYNYGFLAVVLILYLLTKAIGQLYKLGDYRTIALISCFLLYAFVENVLINYYLNPILFFTFYYACRIQIVSNSKCNNNSV